MRSKMLSLALYGVTTALGVATFLYPFFRPQPSQPLPFNEIRAGEAPLLYAFLLGLCVLALLFEAQSQAGDAKVIALLGMLLSINATLRFIENALPGPGGFTPIFFLIILVGYIFGAPLGFVMGAMTLFVSAIITAGVGPWLPSQMFTAGWVGMSAPLVRPLVRLLRAEGRSAEVILLALFGAVWGFLYGAIMNLWAWPFLIGPADQYWSQGIGWREAIQRYALYYMVTSLAWDAAGALGNFLLLLLGGRAVLRLLRRFQQRFHYTVQLSPPEVTP